MNDAQAARMRRAFNKRIKDARIGDPLAQYDVGLMYANGEGVERSVDQALTWIRAAAEKQHASAQYLLANAYASGMGVQKNEQKALLWLLRSAEGGYDKSSLKLGRFFENAHPDVALQSYRAAAELGVAAAQLKLGQHYAQGHLTGQSWESARHWYLQAATQGEARAQCALGSMYEEGQGVPLDLNEAGAWFRQAARRGSPAAQMALQRLNQKGWGRGSEVGASRRKRAGARERRLPDDRWVDYASRGEPDDKYQLGLMFQGGWGVDQSAQAAEIWFEQAALLGHLQAQLALARLIEASDPGRAEEWYEKALSQGDAQAAVALARLRAGGGSVLADELQALLLWSHAARQNHPEGLLALATALSGNVQNVAQAAFMLAAQQGQAQAQYEVGRQYAQGAPNPANDVVACQWYGLAAEQGHADAQCALAAMYLTGRGVAKNERLAFDLFEHSAAQGHSQAQWNLGKMCASGGDGYGRDARRAGTLYKKAANAGFAPAQATLGTLYAQAKKYERANEWWGRAAEQGDTEALFNLANAYRLGLGTPVQPTQGFILLLRAADAGLAAAQARVGLLYATGDGVAQDSIEAYKWFTLGAGCGDETAAANVERAQAMLSPGQLLEGERRAQVWRSAWQNKA